MTLTILICVHSITRQNDIFLIDALKSLENQTYKDFNTLIVFDECWEHTMNRVKSEKFSLKLEFLERQKKEGLAYAKNFGLEHIKTEWVGFLDADDLYMPEKIEKQIEFINNNEVDFLGTLSLNRYGNSKNYFDSCFKKGQYITHSDIENRIYKENIMTHGSLLIKKSAIDNLGGYNNIKGMEDWDLWKRAFDAGYKFHQLQDRLYVWTHGTSVAR